MVCLNAKHKDKRMLKIELKLDIAFSKLHKGKNCQICKTNKAQDTHHILERSDKLYRWDVKNAMFLCRDCHDAIHHRGAEKPLPMFEVESYRFYKIKNCLSDKEFFTIKAYEFGINIEDTDFEKIKFFHESKASKEYRHKKCRENYQKKKLYFKSKKV